MIEDPWDEPVDISQASVPDNEADGSGKDDEQTIKRRPQRRRSLYLVSDNTTLAVGTGDCLEVSEAGHLRLRLRPEMLDRVEIYPNVSIEQAALRLLLKEKIPVIFMDDNGEHLGSAHGRAGTQGRLHLAQAELILDPARRFALAQAIVEARIHNHRALLRRLNRQRNDLSVIRACEDINRTLRKVKAATAFPSLMAYEAQSAKTYWSVLGQLLPNGWIFERRQRRPPATPFDVVLSYLATILTSDLEQIVRRAGLHPSFGILHSTKDDESVCATDLVEEFRGPIAESCAVTLVAQKAVKPDDFAASAKGGYAMTDSARNAIIRGYERWMDRPIADRTSTEKCPWSELIRRQANRLAQAIENRTAYAPYRMDY